MNRHLLSTLSLSLALASLPASAQQIMPAFNAAPSAASAQNGMLDSLIFGDAGSETAHALGAQSSEVSVGLLGQSARRLLPLQPLSWQGGSLAFTLRVDPEKPNYLTIKLSGDDVTETRLLLFAGGKQIGYKHLGDIEQLDFGTPSPAYKGRFFYNTTPLPLELTRGKTQLTLEIRSIGRIWGYGTTFEQYQKNLDEPTRGIYRVYSSTSGYFVPPADEKQGSVTLPIPVRQSPGPEVLDAVKARVSREVSATLKQTAPLDQNHMLFLARAYGTAWTPAFHSPVAVEKIKSSLDALCVSFQKNPRLAEADPATFNPEWFGFGLAGWALQLVEAPMADSLDETLTGANGAGVKRRDAYAQMFVAARDWHRENRRQYTNQSMINDLYGIYLSNRGVEMTVPARALPEAQAVKYLYESVGLAPWLGSEVGGVPQKPLGDAYFQLTDKGLTKELGYVGTYGEVIDWVTQIFEATKTPDNPSGDANLQKRLVEIARARAAFRYPALDAEGNRAMVLEQIVGWRDSHYPGDPTYAQRASWDGTPLEAAAASLDPTLVGYVQQMFADNAFFGSVQSSLKDSGFRTTSGLLPLADQFDKLKNQPPSAARLPMTWSQPDTIFSDEEDGVIAIKNGQEILYASLYWRARYAINNLARVHYLTPNFDRIAVVRQESQFSPSGQTYTRPNRTNMAFTDGGPRYPVAVDSAHAGEQLPVARVPQGVAFKVGDENAYAGKADFYTLRYGPYLIGMNTTRDKTFDLPVPAAAKDLASKQTVPAGQVLRVGPRSTTVLYIGQTF